MGVLELALIRSCLDLDVPSVLRQGGDLADALESLGESSTAARLCSILRGEPGNAIVPRGAVKPPK